MFYWSIYNGRSVEAWKRASGSPWALNDRDASTCERMSSWWLGDTPNDIMTMNTSHPLILTGDIMSALQVFRIRLTGIKLQCQQPLNTTFCSYDPIQLIALTGFGWVTCGLNCPPLYRCRLLEDASPSACQFECNCGRDRCPKLAIMFHPGYLVTSLSDMNICEVDFITDGLG